MDENEINHIVKMYKIKREREFNNYHTKYKYDENLKQRNRERSKIHYQNNMDKTRDNYKINYELHKAKSSYSYYKKLNKLDKFHERHADKVKLLRDNGFKVQHSVELPIDLPMIKVVEEQVEA